MLIPGLILLYLLFCCQLSQVEVKVQGVKNCGFPNPLLPIPRLHITANERQSSQRKRECTV